MLTGILGRSGVGKFVLGRVATAVVPVGAPCPYRPSRLAELLQAGTDPARSTDRWSLPAQPPGQADHLLVVTIPTMQLAASIVSQQTLSARLDSTTSEPARPTVTVDTKSVHQASPDDLPGRNLAFATTTPQTATGVTSREAKPPVATEQLPARKVECR